jgi:hypothetical protein
MARKKPTTGDAVKVFNTAIIALTVNIAGSAL